MMVFAVIGVGFKFDLVLVEGSMDTDRYIQNLDRLGFIEALYAVHEPFGWIFQHDGAPAHISQRPLDWLGDSIDIIMDWPANAPDLSPIEVLWAIFKMLVKCINPLPIEDLKAALVAAWALIPQTSINRLFQAFQPQLELCLVKEGNSISN